MHHVLSPWGSQDDLQRANVELTGRKCLGGQDLKKGKSLCGKSSHSFGKLTNVTGMGSSLKQEFSKLLSFYVGL